LHACVDFKGSSLHSGAVAAAPVAVAAGDALSVLCWLSAALCASLVAVFGGVATWVRSPHAASAAKARLIVKIVVLMGPHLRT